jgi:hypothetical protein
MRIKWTAIHSVVDDKSVATWGDPAPAAERVKRDQSLDTEKKQIKKSTRSGVASAEPIEQLKEM